MVRDATRAFTEFPFVASFCGVQVSGVIDRLQEMPDGNLVVIDLKTGATDEEDALVVESYRVSLSMYCHAVSRMTRKKVSGWVYRVGRDTLVPVPVLLPRDLEPLIAAAVTQGEVQDSPPHQEEGPGQSPGEQTD